MKSKLNENDYLEDAIFRKSLMDKVDELKEQRLELIDRTAIYTHKVVSEIKLRRNAWSYLEQHDMLNIDSLLSECKLMMEKRSELPSMVRSYLASLFSYSMANTVSYYLEQERSKLKTK